jgi:hypothetical protein
MLRPAKQHELNNYALNNGKIRYALPLAWGG